MSASLEKIKLKANESFSIGIFQDNFEECTWHYHDNYEISFITEGSGKRIVADSIEEFQPGDLVFIGKNIPHVWIADKDFDAPTQRKLEMVYLQFSEDVLSGGMLSLPEFQYVAKALNLSERGIRIKDQTLNEVSNLMLQLPYLSSFDRMIVFLELMNIIGKSENLVYLASNDYISKRFTTKNKRIETIHQYLMTNYRKEIDLGKIAELVSMAEGSLCRFFKNQMGITIFEYLNKIKVDFACKLLMDKNLSITDVALDSGFNNISHFNKQFKRITNLQPSEYRMRYKDLKY
ncbi:MAG: AraC family transcriptional regulator [Paludibacter sp.]|nr:AraC family transcriptional regulator [Paludibacter sp.]